MYVSLHAQKRIRERCGTNKKSVHRQAQNALERGIEHKDTSGNLKRWLDKVYLSYHQGNQLRIYGDKLYLFQDDVLITVLNVPQNLMHLVKDAKNKKSKNKKENDDG